ASRRASARRRATSSNSCPRADQAATGSASSSRQTWAISVQSRSKASASESAGKTSWAHSTVGAGTTVQLTSRSLMTVSTSLMKGSWSRPARTGAGPAAGGRGPHVRVGEPLVDDGQHLLDEGQLVSARAHRVEPRERIRGSGPRERDPRGPLSSELETPLPVPAGDEVERISAGMLDARALRIRVEIRDVHEACPAPVRRRSHLARHLLLADGRPYRDD